MLVIAAAHRARRLLAPHRSHDVDEVFGAHNYNGRRPHRGRQLHPPRPDYPVADLSQDRIKHRPDFGGLINEYERVA